MQNLGGETVELDKEGDSLALLGLASVGPRLVTVERFDDSAKSRTHGYAAYRTEEKQGSLFKIDAERMLFAVHEAHFANSPDWHLQLCQDPHPWFDWVTAASTPHLSRSRRAPTDAASSSALALLLGTCWADAVICKLPGQKRNDIGRR